MSFFINSIVICYLRLRLCEWSNVIQCRRHTVIRCQLTFSFATLFTLYISSEWGRISNLTIFYLLLIFTFSFFWLTYQTYGMPKSILDNFVVSFAKSSLFLWENKWLTIKWGKIYMIFVFSFFERTISWCWWYCVYSWAHSMLCNVLWDEKAWILFFPRLPVCKCMYI